MTTKTNVRAGAYNNHNETMRADLPLKTREPAPSS